MMLHTDAFNKNAKSKMSKADYVRNAASAEVPVEILEVGSRSIHCRMSVPDLFLRPILSTSTTI